MRTRLSIILSAAAVAAVTAQAPQDPSQTPTFRGGANYVRVDMYATQDGTPVNDLAITDVELLEDGVPQKIEDFERVVVPPAGSQESRREPDGLRASREAAGDPRARVFVIFLDTYHTQIDGSATMRQPLLQFLDRVLGPDDVVALMTPEMSASQITFGRKTAVIEQVVSNPWWGRRARIADDDPKEMLYRECGAALAIEERLIEELIARRREKLTLDALEDLMVHVGGLRDERKAVMLITEGWMLYEPNPSMPGRAASQSGPVPPRIFVPPVEPPSERGTGTLTQARLQECEVDIHALASVNHDVRLRTIGDEANRGNLTFYPVYARGLVVFDAPIGPAAPPPQAVDSAALRRRHESLRTLAVETDGAAIINTNNISAALKRIADDLSSYYLLGYYSTNARLDGKYRTITVRARRPGVRIRARRGYRARTAEQVVTEAVRRDIVPPAVTSALNSVVGLNSRSTFRVRPSVWMRSQAGATGGTVWVVGELDFRTRREPAWAKGTQAEVILLAADGSQLGATRVEVPAAQGGFAVRVPTASPLAPGDYAVRIRLRAGDAEASDTAKVTVPERPSPLGEAVLWRRGATTGTLYLRTASPSFQRSERLRLELATDEAGVTARMLDRQGKPLQVPVQVSERIDAAEGVRWIVADANLAPLAAGDYVVEITAGDATQVTGFRVVP